jgi:hypothetical protein
MSLKIPRSHPITDSFAPGALPPECRTEKFVNGNGDIAATFDLFQLGMLLWHLYLDRDQQRARNFCSLAGCQNAKINYFIDHDNPIALPKADAGMPEYLHQIITLCRKEDPRQRLAAWKLGEMFPSDEEIACQIEAIAGAGLDNPRASIPLTDLQVARSLVGHNIACDICGERCLSTTYLCLSCRSGNYDVCRFCFDRGLHCEDLAHCLVECDIRGVPDMSTTKRAVYYSCAGPDGSRKRLVR